MGDGVEVVTYSSLFSGSGGERCDGDGGGVDVVLCYCCGGEHGDGGGGVDVVLWWRTWW